MDAFLNYQDTFVLDQEITFLGSGQFLANMTVALICGLLIALLYRWMHRQSKYSATFVNSLVALSMITTIVITVIGNNVARAFGLVGALSIIRFRMALKDVQDIVFIFFALAVGMAAGVDLLLTAIAGTIFIGIVMLVLSQLSQTGSGGTRSALPKERKFALQFSFTPPGEERETPYRPILEKHCQRHELAKAGSSEREGALVLSFSGVLKSDKGENLARELKQIPGIDQVILTLKSRKRRKPRKKKKAK